jgi:hypothetical protein
MAENQDPRIIVAEAMSSDENQEQDSFLAEMPVRKKRKIPDSD